MTSLKRSKNGDWFGRKAIPVDVRRAYKLAYGVSQEERFRRSSTVSLGQAKAEFRDWDATVSSRIDALRAAVSGSSVSLTPRQISALSGEWYQWYVSQYEEDPGQPEDWDSRHEMLEAARDKFDSLKTAQADDAEMTQLQGSQVFQQDGIWIINITPEDGTVKGASFRKVPIHEHLIAQGFLDFVKQSGTGPLFYDPKDQRAESKDPTKPVRPAYVITRQKLAEWVRQDVGVTDPDISPNHAWRHTFKRQAARAGMERRFRFAFCGHESDEVGDIYEAPTLEDMAEALKLFPRYDLE